MSLTQRLDYRRLLLCTPPCSLRIPTPLAHPLARSWSSEFGPQDWWFISPPLHANSHPQHRWASQPDQNPASVSPFSVIPSQSVYAKTDWVPVVLLGSCLGIRSDKPVSRHTHFPLPFRRLYSCQRTRTRGDPEFHRRTDKPQNPLPIFGFCS